MAIGTGPVTRIEGIVQYNPPRTVRVAPHGEDSGDSPPHSTTYTMLAIETETQAQAERLMLEWHKVMLAASKEAKKILEKVKKSETPGAG